MYTYYKLTSLDYNGTIIRINTENHHEDYFNTKEKVWKPIGIMIRYFSPDSDIYEMYEELPKKEVMEAVS
ncbi:hypothetical protein [Enterococcus italicus]|uniref:hypothetical protein n=1 Tax=Enterococcus italicus TaxID=246144 RepID=UPI003FA24CF1